jgi:hypothetical protein
MAWFFSACWWTIVAIADTVWWILTHLKIDLIVVVGVVCLAIVAIFYRALNRGGFWIFLHGTEHPSWRSCTQCSGMGVLMMDGSIIPKEYRTYYKEDDGGYVQKTAIANTKTCEYCLGHGGRWHYSNSALRRDIPTRRPGETWHHD